MSQSVQADRQTVTWPALIKLCRVPYGLVILIGIGLLAPPQLKDMLTAVVTAPQFAALTMAMGLLAFLNWYWARTVVSAHFEGFDSDAKWSAAVRDARLPVEVEGALRWIAYGPVVLCGLIYFILFLESREPAVAFAILVGWVPVMLFVAFRHRWPSIALVLPAAVPVAIVANAVLYMVWPKWSVAVTLKETTQIVASLVPFLTLPFALSPVKPRWWWVLHAAWAVAMVPLCATVDPAGWPAYALSALIAAIPVFVRWGEQPVAILAGRWRGVRTARATRLARSQLAARAGWGLLLVPGILLIVQGFRIADPLDRPHALVAPIAVAVPMMIPSVLALARNGWQWARWLFIGLIAGITVWSSLWTADHGPVPWVSLFVTLLLAAIPLITKESPAPHNMLVRFCRAAPISPAFAGVMLAVGLLVVIAAAFFSLTGLRAGQDLGTIFYPYLLNVSPVLLAAALVAGPLTALSFLAGGYRWTVVVRKLPLLAFAPPVIIGLVYWTLAIPYWFELHPIRVLAFEGPDDRKAFDGRKTLQTHWHDWKTRCGYPRPIVVAINGGATRAGMAGAAVLDQVDHLSQESGTAAIYAISSVSGGSLGAAAYLTALANQPEPKPAGGCTLAPNNAFSHFARELGTGDAIGPLLAGSVFADLPRALFGFVASFGIRPSDGDRGTALERAFEVNAANAMAKAKSPADVTFESSLRAIADGPLWLANGTERDTGARMLTTQIASAVWPFQGASSALENLGGWVRVSTAVNNTARFPFLEPAGVVRPSTASSTRPVSLIDGGYFDNSGLETAVELADWLKLKGADPIVISVTGDGESTLKPDQIVRCGVVFKPVEGRPQKHVWEPLGPILGLYNVRSGHVDLAERRAQARYCEGRHDFFHFYLPAFGKEAVPLNWVLSGRIVDFIWNAMAGTAAKPPEHLSASECKDFQEHLTKNADELSALRRLIAPDAKPAAPTASVCPLDGTGPVAQVAEGGERAKR